MVLDGQGRRCLQQAGEQLVLCLPEQESVPKLPEAGETKTTQES